MSSRCWTLSPTDFAFLWDDCPRCFYLHVARGFPRPAATASELDARLKTACDGRRTETVAPEMPAGVFHVGEHRVDSEALDVHLPDAIHRCVIRGALDVVLKLDDGGYAVVDVAARACDAEQLAARGRRLQACAYALEHPAADAAVLGPVTRLGVLAFAPEKFATEAGGVGALSGGLGWIEVPRDESRLFGFLAEALSVLERPQPPGGAPLCPWCVYRDVSRRTSL
jgi:hypothetical protein